MDRLYHTVGAGVFYVFYNWVLLERGASPLMAQDEYAVVVHQKPTSGYTSQSLLLYNQSSLLLFWTVHYVI